MIIEDGKYVVCDGKACDSSIKNNMWAKSTAHNAGWFFNRDGKAYCPDHVPDWVLEWRKRKEDDHK